MEPDITFTLVGDDWTTYRVTSQTPMGQSFLEVYVPGQPDEKTLPANEARTVTDKAEKCGLAVRIE